MKPILCLFLLVALLKYSYQTPVDKLGFAEDYDLDFNRGGQVKNFFNLDFSDAQEIQVKAHIATLKQVLFAL